MGKKQSQGRDLDYYKLIGERIRYFRKKWFAHRQGGHQSDLGKSLGVAGNAVSLWENGGSMTRDNLLELMTQHDVSVDWLFRGEEMITGRLWSTLMMADENDRQHLQQAVNLLIEQTRERTKPEDAEQR